VVFLFAAAVASDLLPALTPPVTVVQDLVTVALVVLLFDGGMNIGWRRLRTAAGAIMWIGAAGTFATAAGVTVAAHYLAGFGWRAALLLGAALAPTDPAVVFSVLGRKEITGRSGLLLEGEAGANDPVGIALMAALLAAGGHHASGAAVRVAVVFAEQMVIGAAVGVAGALALEWLMRTVPLPAQGLYPLRALAGAFTVYGLAAVAHGSGFLAVFVAGILLGNTRAPYKAEIESFHASLAGIAEIVAFIALGLTIPIHTFAPQHAWRSGLQLAVLLAFLIRPLLLGVLLVPVRLRPGERVFIALAGLKGAVPILLGSYALTAHEASGQRIYDTVAIVVAFSVLVQGSAVPALARWCRIPMHAAAEPWAAAVRLRTEPTEMRRWRIEQGAAADGTLVADLDLPDSVWIVLALREDRPMPVSGTTRLRAGDQLLALTDPEEPDAAAELFGAARA
jgi:cell volume regulation protein A